MVFGNGTGNTKPGSHKAEKKNCRSLCSWWLRVEIEIHWPKLAPAGRIQARLQPVDQGADLFPVSRPAGADQVAQRLRLDRQQRLGARARVADEGVVDDLLVGQA